jgi:alkanesulfonate monooxygenase SsuD/methylene tetrahydromethanopterin reductase-like flavin-dependent oxidoreductase (luciferase family)
MKFGLFGGATAAAAPSQAASERLLLDQPEDSHSYGAFIDAIVEAESLGFHSIFLVEHHFTGEAQVSAPMNLLTYLAAKTSTIRFYSRSRRPPSMSSPTVVSILVSAKDIGHASSKGFVFRSRNPPAGSKNQ